MTYRGTVKGGVVVIREGSTLPDGTEVTIAPVEAMAAGESAGQNSVWKSLTELGRKAESEPCELPADLAANHDHYLHGLPKRR